MIRDNAVPIPHNSGTGLRHEASLGTIDVNRKKCTVLRRSREALLRAAGWRAHAQNGESRMRSTNTVPLHWLSASKASSEERFL